MVQTIQARNVALNDLENQFKIKWVEDDQFFREWQNDLPEISDYEKQRLDRVKASYRNLLKRPPPTRKYSQNGSAISVFGLSRF